MKIGGFQKTSLLDYPDEISAIIWTIGCNFNCPFCYNADLVKKTASIISEEEIISFLEKRKNVIDGLVITGGEPFLQKDIGLFCEKVKKIGYKIKIDTNGTFPEKLKELLDKKLVNYIAMDVKAPKNKYKKISGVDVDVSKIDESIQIIKNNVPDYEFRTTVVPGLLDSEDIVEIAKWLDGSKKFYLQQFKDDAFHLSEKFDNVKPYDVTELDQMLQKIKPYFKECFLRGT
ncbi:MAG: anaerobic ribonucleoside-triphosphate reductase activating protein [Candidatus Thermoplasmatota archaeon]|nr:anaerobic ribonucleoside-triphosphate reductase activating protein [Candidatus Thermoplasmatota archaeon]